MFIISKRRGPKEAAAPWAKIADLRKTHPKGRVIGDLKVLLGRLQEPQALIQAGRRIVILICCFESGCSCKRRSVRSVF